MQNLYEYHNSLMMFLNIVNHCTVSLQKNAKKKKTFLCLLRRLGEKRERKVIFLAAAPNYIDSFSMQHIL